MIELPQYSKKNIAVFGLGKTGMSAINSLMRSGANIYAWDDNYVPSIEGVNIAPPSDYSWSWMDALVLSPGIPFKSPSPHPVVLMAQEAGCQIISDMDLLYEARPDAIFVGITGTNGKSTTSSLINHILQDNNLNSCIGGNIGTAALELPADPDIYILEMSSYQLDLSQKIKFDFSVLLSITSDHIDRHGSLENYIEAKRKIFTTDSIGVISIDNKINQQLKIERAKHCSTESILSNGFSFMGGVVYSDGQMITDLMAPNIVGENLILAYTTCSMLGLKDQDIVKSISTFKGLPHRMELIATINGITFVNDSKATNVEAAQQALMKYKNIYWITGGRSKNDDIQNFNLQNVRKVFLIGEAMDIFYNSLRVDSQCIDKSYTLQDALYRAYHTALQTEDQVTILLSPACSSFDQWLNFEERGNAFKNIVSDIINS